MAARERLDVWRGSPSSPFDFGTGFDPRDAAASARALAAAGFGPPAPLGVGGAHVVVVADTSGLHARGLAKPGRRRAQLLPRVWSLPRLLVDDPPPASYGEAAGGGVNCAPRKNVFHCDRWPTQCALP